MNCDQLNYFICRVQYSEENTSKLLVQLNSLAIHDAIISRFVFWPKIKNWKINNTDKTKHIEGWCKAAI